MVTCHNFLQFWVKKIVLGRFNEFVVICDMLKDPNRSAEKMIMTIEKLNLDYWIWVPGVSYSGLFSSSYSPDRPPPSPFSSGFFSGLVFSGASTPSPPFSRRENEKNLRHFLTVP